MEVKYPDVEVQLTNQDGNAFSIIARVGVALRRAGHWDAEQEWKQAAFDAESYDALLQLAMEWVEVS